MTKLGRGERIRGVKWGAYLSGDGNYYGITSDLSLAPPSE